MEQEKLHIELVASSVKGDKLKGFLKFCFEQSDELCICNVKPASKVQEILSQYPLIKKETTKETHCTRGPLATVYYFKSEALKAKMINKMRNLFEPIVLDGKSKVVGDDPAFYRKGELLCSICSHESMGSLTLTPDQYEQFKSLKIPHDVYNPHKPLSFNEYLQACTEQEREELTIWGRHEAMIPDEVGGIKSLKVLEIFDQEVTYLPKSLEELVNLECLRITGNQVEALGFDIAKLKHLKVLDLSGMPLKSFPMGILELTKLEKLYLDGMKSVEVPKALMELHKLKVLTLPKGDYTQYHKTFKYWMERLKPKTEGVSLRDILGEEAWERIINEGSAITRGE